MNDQDAADARHRATTTGSRCYNDHGVVVTRAVRERAHPARASASSTTSPERTDRRAASRRCAADRRAGGHNSLTRVRLKPTLMCGGYGQFTYDFNYWGPTG